MKSPSLGMGISSPMEKIKHKIIVRNNRKVRAKWQRVGLNS